jgi:hypothetical protein
MLRSLVMSINQETHTLALKSTGPDPLNSCQYKVAQFYRIYV